MYALPKPSTIHSTTRRLLPRRIPHVVHTPHPVHTPGGLTTEIAQRPFATGSKHLSNHPPRIPTSKALGIAHTLTRHPKDLPASVGGTPGRNLSDRWAQKERSLRKKEGLIKDTQEILHPHNPGSSSVGGDALNLTVSDDHTTTSEAATVSAAVTGASSSNAVDAVSGGSFRGAATAVEMFKGFVIPQKPNPPADDECCMSGCATCVWDLYDDSMDSYEDAVRSVQSNLRALGVAEAEWPESIRPSAGSKDTAEGGGAKSQVLSAFEELERSLKAKQAQ